MTDNKKYPSCNIAGNGKLEILSSGKKVSFKLISISAESAFVQMEENIDTSLKVLIHIVMKSSIFEVRINAEGIIKMSRKMDSGYQYEIAFINLSEDDQNEINDLMVSSCDLSYV
ncbi:MAG TPA: hypothetical protein VIO64_00690 [Pseudobacteroides sp.]|uniref:hypothetical protein n=1 Tax=Pseudobacteroides sp. TaxID=1968840 RepID=UPI002F959CD1